MPPTEPVWVEKDTVIAIHDANLARHGGLEGLRDGNLLESALARPKNAFAYEQADLFQLAAAYGFGIARNHPFLDANKRTAYMVMRLFLHLNGFILTASKEERILVMPALAEGKMDESTFAKWLKKNSAGIKKPTKKTARG